MEATPNDPARDRDASIDWLRGVVMVLMVLDHARDFYSGMRVRPTDLAVTTPALFATRWITHFCAPVFVFLAGTAAYLYGERRSASDLSRFLLTRGIWLVILELTIVRFAWIPDPTFRFFLLQVIWALGWSMIAMAALSRLGARGAALLGGLIVLGHNALDVIRADDLGGLRGLWVVLHERSMLQPGAGRRVFVAYPVLPWIGVMALGFGFGRLVRLPAEARRRVLLGVGAAVTGAFLVLRAVNVYGDPTPWSPRDTIGSSAMSFLNTEKYPPSLAFLAMTLGPAIVALALAPRVAGSWWGRAMVVYGSAPLLFYVAHLYLLRFTAAPLAYARFGARAFTALPDGTAGSPELGLGWAYLAWIVAVVALYPLCRWFGALKRRRKDLWWLSYL